MSESIEYRVDVPVFMVAIDERELHRDPQSVHNTILSANEKAVSYLSRYTLPEPPAVEIEQAMQFLDDGEPVEAWHVLDKLRERLK